MTPNTQRKLLTCKVCGQTRGKALIKYFGDPSEQDFIFDGDIKAHMRAAHRDVLDARSQKSRQTREANQAAKRQQAQDAEARMKAASERVIDAAWSPEQLTYYEKAGLVVPHQSYEIVLTYRADPRTSRRPTPEALVDIACRVQEIARLQEELEQAKAAAWESGMPVTEAEVAAVREVGKEE